MHFYQNYTNLAQ